MRVVFFAQSATPESGRGCASALRGIVTELQQRGHDIFVHELSATLDLTSALDGVEVVIVPATSDGADSSVVPELIARIGHHHGRTRGYTLLLHDTCDHSISDPASLAALDLRHYDGVLACGDAVARLYVERGWIRDAWSWPTAADVRVFYPRQRNAPGRATSDPGASPLAHLDGGDLVWIGRVGEDLERQRAFQEFFIAPAQRLGIRAAVYGAGYTEDTRRALAAAGIEYRGWIPNERVPEVFSRYAVTVFMPRTPYVRSLQGVATTPLFEAMACGIPVVSAGWRDTAGLFASPSPFLVAESSTDMASQLDAVLTRPSLRSELARRGLREIQARHTCSHRVDELLGIVRAITGDSRAA